MSAHIVLANMGCELLGFEAISTALKRAGHRVSLAFDPALFDDRVYLRNKYLARVFNITNKIIADIIELKPDVVGLYVISDTYRWCRYVARKLKDNIDVPILVGGVVPTASPERLINEDWVDIACISDGVRATTKYLNSVASGVVDTSIDNLWFKTNDGKIIKNSITESMNINEEQIYDKTLYENHIPMNHCYMTVSSKGCPFKCSYCSQSFLQPIYSSEGYYCKWRDVENTISELKKSKERYNFQEIDFRDNTFISNQQYVINFLNRFIEEFGNIPFKIMTYPGSINIELVTLLMRAGCYKIQFGVQSVSENTRHNVLNRPGTNDKMIKGFKTCDEAGMRYSIDHIFNLPGETEAEQINAALIYSKCKCLSRITCFWLAYFPGTNIVNIARDMGVITQDEVDHINSLDPDGFYLDTGILKNKKRIRMFNRYHVLFRAIPILPHFIVRIILKLKLHYLFNLVPRRIILWFIDSMVTLFYDREGISYLKSNWWHIKRILKYAITGRYRVNRNDFEELFNTR